MINRHEERQALHSLAPYEMKMANIHTMTVKMKQSRVIALPFGSCDTFFLLVVTTHKL